MTVDPSKHSRVSPAFLAPHTLPNDLRSWGGKPVLNVLWECWKVQEHALGPTQYCLDQECMGGDIRGGVEGQVSSRMEGGMDDVGQL